ncbi:hypothetical protein K2173_004626 [Erythroxylum novogranatense]|uniref:Uncharacterized protein n=1 Tax=Erythroxylum novogranatense TaxID=1862640 RepID=A0AAV8UBL8_9ROSI|nr:hypothetical protein K2173_004626 [Erythroxylum novogranatense]
MDELNGLLGEFGSVIKELDYTIRFFTTLHKRGRIEWDADISNTSINKNPIAFLMSKFYMAMPLIYVSYFVGEARFSCWLESFPWSHDSCFMYTMENHNSVLGIREYALSQGAATCAVDVENPSCCCQPSTNHSNSVKILQHPVQRRNKAKIMEGRPTGDTYNLFAFPSECNFSGLRFGLDLVKSVKEESEKILEGSPYFNEITIYIKLKLLIDKMSPSFKKTYFSGGNRCRFICDMDFVKRREGIEELLRMVQHHFEHIIYTPWIQNSQFPNQIRN